MGGSKESHVLSSPPLGVPHIPVSFDNRITETSPSFLLGRPNLLPTVSLALHLNDQGKNSLDFFFFSVCVLFSDFN